MPNDIAQKCFSTNNSSSLTKILTRGLNDYYVNPIVRIPGKKSSSKTKKKISVMQNNKIDRYLSKDDAKNNVDAKYDAENGKNNVLDVRTETSRQRHMLARLDKSDSRDYTSGILIRILSSIMSRLKTQKFTGL